MRGRHLKGGMARIHKSASRMKSEIIVSTEDEMVATYHRKTARKIIFILICIFLMFVVAGYSITIGRYEIGFWQVYETIWDHYFGEVQDTTIDHVVCNLRMPRILMGIIAGAGLALAGAVMQGILKNPLADPYTTGISSGASMGATLAMTAGIEIVSGTYSVVANAFIFSLIPVAVIILVAKFKGGSPVTMILSGLAVMYFFNSITTLMMLRADPDDVAAVYQWQVGTLSTASWSGVNVTAVVVIVGILLCCLLSTKINIMASGDENAVTLGVNVTRLRILCLLIVSFVSASIVAFTGIIGFVGLVCPHIVRMFVGSDHRFLIPASAAFGAAFLLICDYIARTALSTGSLHVGVVTSFIGGPMFLYLILRQKRGSLE